MAHLIDKDRVVAELEKLKYIIMPYPTMAEKVAYRDGIEDAIKIVIKSLEVKEVDLEKEINDYFITVDLYEGEKITENTFRKIAKHFFELGLKAQKEGMYNIKEK